MPRHYSPDRKADALQRLQANGGDILATHVETGIPQRTLYHWRTDLWIQRVLQRQTLPPPPQKEIPMFEDDLEALLGLRHEIIALLHKIASSVAPISPYRLVDRVRAQTGLLDCILMMENALRPHLDARREFQSPSPLANWSRWDTPENPETIIHPVPTP